MNVSLRYLMTIISICLTILAGCDGDQNEKQQSRLRKVQFKFSAPSQVTTNGKTVAVNADALLVSIEDENGVPFYSLERVEIYQLNEGYISVPVSLPQGNYKLTLFALVDGEDNIVAATPTEESPVAEFVTDPLPIEFEVADGETTILNPEVILIEEGIDVGYAQFGIDIVKLHPISVSVFQNEDGIRGQMISASLTIEGQKSIDGGVTWENFWTKSFELDGDVNSIYVKGGNDKFDGSTEPDYYYFKLQKAGFYPATYVFSSGDLRDFPAQIFDLIKNYTQLKSITADVYCCPGSGFVPTRTNFVYNSRGQLKKATHQYQSNSQWYTSLSMENMLDDLNVIPSYSDYTYAGGGHTYINNTVTNGSITGIETFNNVSSSEMGNYTITLARNPNTNQITDASLYDKDYNSTLNYHYVYNGQGDLISFEARQGGSNDLLYQGEFTYDNYNNVYPQHILGDWLENMTNMGYDRLLHIPFMVNKPKHNIVSYTLSMFSEAEGLYSKETITMNYGYDSNGRPSSLGVQDLVQVSGQADFTIERQKNTVFVYN